MTDDDHTTEAFVDVEVPADTWARIYADVRDAIRSGLAPEYAWQDAVNEYVITIAVPTVDGERRTLSDVLEDMDVDEDELGWTGLRNEVIGSGLGDAETGENDA